MTNIKNKRPPVLSALCILTFIGSTVGFLSYFLASLLFEKTVELVIKYSAWSSAESLSPLFFTILMVSYAISLTGAIRMWKAHRDGFFLYFFSQITILFLPILWMNWQSFSTTNAIFTGVFLVGYGLNWRWFR